MRGCPTKTVKPGSDHWVKKDHIVGMVRIEEGLSGGGVFRGRRSSKDMRDGADTRDREKPRTVANMRERDRTLRWKIILFILVTLYHLFIQTLKVNPAFKFKF